MRNRLIVEIDNILNNKDIIDVINVMNIKDESLIKNISFLLFKNLEQNNDIRNIIEVYLFEHIIMNIDFKMVNTDFDNIHRKMYKNDKEIILKIDYDSLKFSSISPTDLNNLFLERTNADQNHFLQNNILLSDSQIRLLNILTISYMRMIREGIIATALCGGTGKGKKTVIDI